MDDCLFCKIVRGDLPSTKVYEDDEIVAFRDIHPAAPTHVLVVPKTHRDSLSACEEGDASILGRLFLAANRVAEMEGLESFRLIVNNGSGAGQTVWHLHLHVLGGREMGAKLL